MIRNVLAIPFGIFLGFVVLYLASMPVVYQDNGDAGAEFVDASKEKITFRSNHLLLTPVNWMALRSVGEAFSGGRRFIALQLLTIVCGAAGLGVFFCTLRDVRCPFFHALLLTLIMGLSYAYWLHSRESESGIVSQFFANLALWGVSRQFRAGEDGGGPRFVWIAGLGLAGAILFATNCLFLYPPLALAVWLAASKDARWRPLLLFTAVSGLATLIPFLVAGAASLDRLSIDSFMYWMTHHGSETSLSESRRLNLNNLLRAVSGVINFFSGYTVVTTAVKLRLHGLETPPIPPGNWIRFVVGGLVLAYLAAHLLARRRMMRQPRVFGVILTALICLGFFNTFWFGSDPQFWLPGIPFLLMAPAVAFSTPDGEARSEKVSAAFLGAAALGLLVCNLPYPVPTPINMQGGADWRKAENFGGKTTPTDLLIFAAHWPGYFKAFGRPQLANLLFGFYETGLKGEAYLARMDDRIDAALKGGGSVYLYGILEIEDHQTISMWGEIGHLYKVTRRQLADHLKARYNPQVVDRAIFPGAMWVITPGGSQ